MQNYTCPSCGAAIHFTSSVSVSCVCPACRSLVVRKDVNVESLGQMAQLPEDISPFQLGTTGTYKGVHFGIIGRLRQSWEDGAWNEWFLWFDNGRHGWLAEAQGFLSVNFEDEIAARSLPKKDVVPSLDDIFPIHGKNYSVADVKKVTCMGSEGELPFAAPKGGEIIAVDLIGSAGGFAGIEYEQGQPPSVFIGEYMEFDALNFRNLRELPGWKIPYPIHEAKHA